MVAVTTKRSHIDPRDLPEVQRATLRRILLYLRPYKTQTILVVIAIVLGALLGLLPPMCIKAIVDDAIPHHDRLELIELCLAMVAGPLVVGLLGVAQRYLAAYIAEHVMFDLRNQVFRHVQKQSLTYFMTSRPGEVVSRVLNDVQGVGQMLQDNLVKLLQNAMIVTTAVGVGVTECRDRRRQPARPAARCERRKASEAAARKARATKGSAAGPTRS